MAPDLIASDEVASDGRRLCSGLSGDGPTREIATLEAKISKPVRKTMCPDHDARFNCIAQRRWVFRTGLDPINFAQLRRSGLSLICDHRLAIKGFLGALGNNQAVTVEIASVPERIRGFCRVKLRYFDNVKFLESRFFSGWRGGPEPVQLERRQPGAGGSNWERLRATPTASCREAMRVIRKKQASAWPTLGRARSGLGDQARLGCS